VKVLKELDTLCKDSCLTPDTVKAAASKLFRHCQHLLDEFLMLGPSIYTSFVFNMLLNV
jgi:hypothetical protein